MLCSCATNNVALEHQYKTQEDTVQYQILEWHPPIKTIDNKTDEQAGKDSKNSKHIERYHSVDTDNAYTNFINAEKFFNNFPKFAQLSVGVPLVLTFLFLLIGYFYCYLTAFFKVWFIDSIVIFISLLGLVFIYLNTTKSITTLTKINQ